MIKSYSTPDFNLTDQNALIGSAVFLDLASSLLSSGLISWKIASVIKRSSAHPFSTLGHFNSNWRIRFALEIIIQSAAAYSMVSIAYGIVSVLPADTQKSYAAIDAARLYLSDLFTFTAVCFFSKMSSSSNLFKYCLGYRTYCDGRSSTGGF